WAIVVLINQDCRDAYHRSSCDGCHLIPVNGKCALNPTQHRPLLPECGSSIRAIQGVSMSITVVLAVCVDSWLLASYDAAWRSAGFIVIPAASIRDAIDHFQAGDFDLVLLGHSISNEDMERLVFLVRASGSQTPVVSIADLTGDRDFLADKA